MLKPGTVAPEFILPDENGNDVSLSDLLQQDALILYFYPADFTPGCTKEACAFRDLHGAECCHLRARLGSRDVKA